MTPDHETKNQADSQSYEPSLPPITRILLVEDNKIDSRLTRNALEQIANWPSIISIVDDGEQAMQFLLHDAGYADALMPDLVILDLNLPKHDGVEVLQMIRASTLLRRLLVFIFSSSPIEISEDRTRKAGVKADAYFEKPSRLATFLTIAVQIHEHYLRALTERKIAAGA